MIDQIKHQRFIMWMPCWLVLVALGIVVACTPLVQIMLHDFLPSWMLDLNWSQRSSAIVWISIVLFSLCARQLNRDSECCGVWAVLITASVFFRVGFSCWNYFAWFQLSCIEKLISWWMIKSSWIVGLHIIHTISLLDVQTSFWERCCSA